MENIPKAIDFIEVDDDAKRRHIDAKTVFQAWEEACLAAKDVRGGMYWKRTGQKESLYAFEMAAGVRIVDASAMETRDVDLLWDTRKRVQFIGHMKLQGASIIGVLRKVDPTFIVRHDQKYTATNSKGFEVDIIRREVAENDPNPVKNAATLLHALRFSSIVVSPSGYMARMNTISPLAFARFKHWMAKQTDRDPLKRSRDLRQATVVEDYLPHLL